VPDAPASKRDYPRAIALDNGTAITLRLMTPDDAERMVAFAESLPADDLLFLRSDITNPTVVAQWVKSVEAGRTATVIADAGGELAGYASLHHHATSWQRHLGEIQLQTGQRYRSQGLGRALAGEMFALATALGLRKIVAQMTVDQRGAIATFERLGFHAEALLSDFVIDRADRTRDLMVMAYDVAGLTEHLD
jgi:RimJ/RimL family protein N-acetyltransferase